MQRPNVNNRSVGYQTKVLSGFSWQTALKVVLNLIVVGKIAILARLLGPEDFGVFSLVMIALGVTEAAMETGVNTTLLRTRESISYYVSTAWIIAIVRGFLVGLVMILLGVGLQHLYQKPELLYLTAIAALVPVIKGFINPAIINLRKNFKFRADTLYQFTLRVVESIAAICLVWWLQGVVGWILGLIVSAVVEVTISFLFFRTRPHFAYSAARAKVILQSAKGFAISSVLGYLNENVDNLLIGKLAGTFSLGLYQPTYSLAHEPTYEVAKSLHHGALPALTQIATDKQRLRRALLKSLVGVLGFAGLLSVPLLVAPGFFIPLVFGDKWDGAIELVRWLMVAGLTQAIFMVSYSVLLARNSLKAMNFHQFLSFISMVSAIIILTPRAGVYGAVVGLAFSRIATLPVLAWLMWSELKCRHD